MLLWLAEGGSTEPSGTVRTVTTIGEVSKAPATGASAADQARAPLHVDWTRVVACTVALTLPSCRI